MATSGDSGESWIQRTGRTSRLKPTPGFRTGDPFITSAFLCRTVSAPPGSSTRSRTPQVSRGTRTHEGASSRNWSWSAMATTSTTGPSSRPAKTASATGTTTPRSVGGALHRVRHLPRPVPMRQRCSRRARSASPPRWTRALPRTTRQTDARCRRRRDARSPRSWAPGSRGARSDARPPRDGCRRRRSCARSACRGTRAG
jgi:hypothetical protein